MSRIDLLRRAKRRLDHLSEQRLRTADDILSYLEDLDSDEATEELLRIPGLLDRIEKAEQDIAQGKTVFAGNAPGTLGKRNSLPGKAL